MSKAKYSNFRPHKRVQEHGDLVNPHTGEAVTPPSMTKQEFVRESDINNIVKHFSPRHMAVMTQQVAMTGRYEDLPDGVDYQESLHLVAEAKATFMTLPAKVRDRFGHDPAEFLVFIANPDNAKEARELGLLKPVEAPPQPLRVEVVNPAPGSPQDGPQGRESAD